MPNESNTRSRRRRTRAALAPLACVLTLIFAAGAHAQGSTLGSTKKLSSAPPTTVHTGSTTSTSRAASSSATSTSASTSSTASASAAPGKRLPYTGSNLWIVTLIGVAFLLSGFALRGRARDASR